MADRPPPSRLRRALLLLTGCLAMVLGALGVVLPLLPATPFVLIAAGCFAGAWPSLYARLASSRLFGPMLRAGPQERHLPRATKVGAIVFTCVSIGASLYFLQPTTWLCVLLVGIALGVSAFLWWMPSAPRTG